MPAIRARSPHLLEPLLGELARRVGRHQRVLELRDAPRLALAHPHDARQRLERRAVELAQRVAVRLEEREHLAARERHAIDRGEQALVVRLRADPAERLALAVEPLEPERPRLGADRTQRHEARAPRILEQAHRQRLEVALVTIVDHRRRLGRRRPAHARPGHERPRLSCR